MKTSRWVWVGLLIAIVHLTGCASPRVAGLNTAPNAGITITSSKLNGGPYANGEIYVTANDPTYCTQWCPYKTTLPTNPIWRETTPGANNPGPFAPGSRFVRLKANRPVNFSSNPVSVNVVAGWRTKIAIVYP
jgi:hypothetical protein